MATAPGAYDIPGSPQSRRMVIFIGCFIGLSWLGIYLAGDAADRDLASEFGLRPFGRGFHPVQLLTHSLVHGDWILLLDLPFLPFVIHLSRNQLTPAALIRVYSLGVLWGALLYLLGTSLAIQINETHILTGGILVPYAIFGSALVHPNPQAHRFRIDSSLSVEERLMLFPLLLPVVLSCMAFGLIGLMVCITFPIVLFNPKDRGAVPFLVMDLTVLSSFGIGLVCGLVEKRRWRKAGASSNTNESGQNRTEV